MICSRIEGFSRLQKLERLLGPDFGKVRVTGKAGFSGSVGGGARAT